MRLIKPAWIVFVKTGVVCNAGCETCPAGRKLPEDREQGGNMKPEMFRRIMDRITLQGRISMLQLYYYNEPCLVPDIAELFRIAHRYGVTNTVCSTNGSYMNPLRSILRERPGKLMFSVSGFTQAVHERSHAHTDIEKIKKNMEEAAWLISHTKGARTFVQVSWHDYAYNQHERGLMQDFCEGLGFRFVPYDTGVLPLERPLARFAKLAKDPNSPPERGERDIRTSLAEARLLCLERKDWSCIQQQRILTVDSNGMLHSCNGKTGVANIRQSIFDVCLEEFNRYRKEEDPACKACKAIGGHIYSMQQYRVPKNWKTDLMKKGEDVWRNSHLGGLFPWASRIYTNLTYTRPSVRSK